MPVAALRDVELNYKIEGPEDGAPVVFIHALGTNLNLWDAVIDRLPKDIRAIRFDLRGHGQSSCPPAPYSMGALVRDTESFLDHLKIRNCVMVGLSIGGMVTQGLAVKRLDQIRALVLSHTAAKIATPKQWEERIDAVERDGVVSQVAPSLERWLWSGNRQSDIAQQLGTMIQNTQEDGFKGCCKAIAGTDFYTPTSSLRLPALGIAGSDDGSTPADLVKETVDLIPGSEFKLIRKSGHMSCVEQPDIYSEALVAFLRKIGHSNA